MISEEEIGNDGLIQDIEALFPPDNHPNGREFLLQALCESWRELPKSILVTLRRLCVQEEQRQAHS